jgi:hypothetical protein
VSILVVVGAALGLGLLLLMMGCWGMDGGRRWTSWERRHRTKDSLSGSWSWFCEASEASEESYNETMTIPPSGETSGEDHPLKASLEESGVSMAAWDVEGAVLGLARFRLLIF